ncbi:MAG: glycosyltransferase family 1 protein [Candidatus Hecatellales archaeon]|nr:MAG: glycosyltransferase family 1 protein [Candidatus Hecatellales archaeon]
MKVYFIVTHGKRSLDLYSLRLSRYLNVPKLHTNLYSKIAETFGSSLLKPSTLRMFLEVCRFSRALRKLPGIPHLPNHHMGRFTLKLEKPFIITVHDVMRYLDIEFNRGLISKKPTPQDKYWIRLDFEGIKKASKIIVPSHFTGKELAKYVGVPADKIHVIYHGIDEVFKPRPGQTPCPKPYILYVGSEHPRKNLSTVLQAFAKLKKEKVHRKLKLVKVGSAGSREADFRAETLQWVSKLHLQGEVIFLGWVSPETLATLYTEAELLVFPSIYEGFGWPPLEAMACGCPVVSSNKASMPEIFGDAALYVNPYDVDGWVHVLDQVLLSDRLKRRLSNLGRQHAKKFTWKKAAEETLKVYQQVAEDSPLISSG